MLSHEGFLAEDRSLTLAEVRALLQPVNLSSAPLPESAQVVIVGAGPAGLTAANLLGHYGVDTLVLDARSGTSDQPKAIAIDDEYVRLLHKLGLAKALEGHQSPPFGIWFMGANGKPVIRASGATTANGFGRRAAVMQPVFEQILLTGALQHKSVDVRFEAQVEAIEQSATGVKVRVGDKTVRADYLLGCDGVRSFVRNSAGINFVGSRIDEPHLVVDLAEFPDQSPYSRFFCNPRRPLNSIPSVYGGRRIEFMLTPDDDHDELITDEGVRRLVDNHTPYRGAPLHIVRRAIYGFAEQIADRLQSGRIFLMGDAAHVMPPFGGQGMNTAARDANNLCWKLAWVLNGRASKALLDTYDAERRQQINAIIKYSVLIGRFANIRSRPLAFARDTLFRAIQLLPGVRKFFSEMRYMPRPQIPDGLVAAPEKRFDRFVGYTLPRWTIEQGQAALPIDEIAGKEFCLVGFDVPSEALVAAGRHPIWGGERPQLIALSSSNSPQDPAVLAARFHGLPPADAQHLRGAICVVRPDRYVAAVFTPPFASKYLDELAMKIA